MSETETVVIKKLGSRHPGRFTFPEEEPSVLPKPTKLGKLQSRAVDEAMTFAGLAHQITVTNEETLGIAKDYLQDLRTMVGKIEATFDPQITKAHALHKSLLTEKKKFYEPLMMAEKVVKRAVAFFYEEQDRRRAEAEKERQRIEAEAIAKANELEAEAVGAKTDAERDKIINEAVTVLEAADTKGQQLTAGAAAPKIVGIAISDLWHFEIVDASLIPAEYLTPDLVKIGKVVRALKGDAKIPGVRTYSEKAVASRAI